MAFEFVDVGAIEVKEASVAGALALAAACACCASCSDVLLGFETYMEVSSCAIVGYGIVASSSMRPLD